MRVLYLLDHDFAMRERKLIERLEVGLAAEGVKTIRMEPESVAATQSEVSVAGRIVRYPPFGPLATRRQRGRMLESLAREALKDESGAAIDVVHVFAPSMWSLGAELARALAASWAIEVWSDAAMSRAARIRTGRGLSAPVLMAADPALVDRARASGRDAAIRQTTWGVHALQSPQQIMREDATFSVVMSSSGMEPGVLHQAMAGIAAMVKIEERILVFVESGAAGKARLWREAETLGLLSRMSLIPDLEVHRDLVMACDVLLLPDMSGQVRTLALEALAHGMGLVATRDDRVSLFRGDLPIGRFVSHGDRAGWIAALEGVVRDRDRTRELARQGWSLMREQRRVSTHVTSVFDAYQWMRSKDAMPFAAR
ncbi:MAG: glycosyltransferase [Phycisphaeraceae bacterium]|nr:glycosyltransferase [Phycisphaeraceae bacterium]MCW5753625.1 glycosyltransferase [Phycisphaeraceae bacterium]